MRTGWGNMHLQCLNSSSPFSSTPFMTLIGSTYIRAGPYRNGQFLTHLSSLNSSEPKVELWLRTWAVPVQWANRRSTVRSYHIKIRLCQHSAIKLRHEGEFTSTACQPFRGEVHNHQQLSMWLLYRRHLCNFNYCCSSYIYILLWSINISDSTCIDYWRT
jgi:hypothetical protein